MRRFAFFSFCGLLFGACENGGVGPVDLSDADTITTITLFSPRDYQTYQRDVGGQADIPIGGWYSGTPASIEARFNGGPWSTIDAQPTAGTYSGTLERQSGQGTLEVRFAADTGIAASAAYVGIGDVFIVAGQSNASGRGSTYQAYTHAGLKAAMYRQDGRWVELKDPTDSDDGAGSAWPLLATLHMADQGVPVAFVTTADGGTGLAAPDGDWSKGGMQYRGFLATVRSSGVNDATAILWHQGERDARNGISQREYQTALSAMVLNMQADLGGHFADLRLVCAQIGMVAGRTAAQLDPIRLAQANRWDNDPDVLAGPVLHDVKSADGHFRTDAELQTLANRWWRALKYHFYGGAEPARGPQFSGASYAGNRVTVAFEGGQGSLVNVTDATGWHIVDSGGIRTLVSLSGTDETVTLILDQDLRAPVSVTFGSGNSGAGTTLHDSGTYPLPPEPFVARSATSGAGKRRP
ncbi:MAG: sialate O-acetylesterase [Armatimonadota bacterium]